MSNAPEPDPRRDPLLEDERDLDAEQVVEDAVEFFGEDDDGPPIGEADAPAPPG